jgi:DNA-binding NtrC family response regulator
VTEKQKKILIVDDSKGWLDYHYAALKEFYGAEFALEVANSARSGYDMVYNNLKEPYSLIISDLQMELDFEPKHAGEWFIEQVKKLKEYQNVPIIIISASYNVRSIASKLRVNCLPKAIAARDLTAYRLAINEILSK